MISNATRLFCAMLSTLSAAGLVAFADPAVATGKPAAAAVEVATLPAPITARG